MPLAVSWCPQRALRETPALRTLEEIYRYAVETRGRQLTGALGHLADVDALPARALHSRARIERAW